MATKKIRAICVICDTEFRYTPGTNFRGEPKYRVKCDRCFRGLGAFDPPKVERPWKWSKDGKKNLSIGTRHGRTVGYITYSCRCNDCKAAVREYYRNRDKRSS